MSNEITRKTILNGGLSVLTGYVPDEAEENYFEVSEIGFIPHSFFQVTLPWLGKNNFEAEMTIDIAEQLIVKRLNDVIREEGGQVYGLGADAVRNRYLGDLIISSSSEPETVNSVIRAIGLELNRLAYGDIQADLDVVKTEAVNLQKASPKIAGLLVNGLTDTNRFGKLYSVEESINEINNVSVDDLQNIYRQTLSGNRVFIGMGPDGSFMPEEEFRDIMRLQEPSSKRILGPQFNL